MNERLPVDDDAGRLALSAAADGECQAHELELGCSRWRTDEAARRDWHAYHLIGDVLRSEDLGHPSLDGPLLARLRTQLAQEPALLAPMPVEGPVTERAAERTWARQRALRRWRAPLGMAAGVALVASAVWVNRPEAPMDGTATQVLVRSSTPGNPSAFVSAASLAPNAQAQAQFERYVSAHKQYQSTGSLGPASGYLRSAVYESSSDR